uniref:Uncharacterized protein n=1 Tax=Ditylenchus dipsaci TaxID=166011 RepID=A0A915DTM9_9BILA
MSESCSCESVSLASNSQTSDQTDCLPGSIDGLCHTVSSFCRSFHLWLLVGLTSMWLIGSLVLFSLEWEAQLEGRRELAGQRLERRTHFLEALEWINIYSSRKNEQEWDLSVNELLRWFDGSVNNQSSTAKWTFNNSLFLCFSWPTQCWRLSVGLICSSLCASSEHTSWPICLLAVDTSSHTTLLLLCLEIRSTAQSTFACPLEIVDYCLNGYASQSMPFPWLQLLLHAFCWALFVVDGSIGQIDENVFSLEYLTRWIPGL